MDLALTDDQELLVASIGALLDKHSSPEDVRAAEPLGFDAELWQSLQELGPVHMAIAEEHSGWGASLLDLCLVAEALGRRCAPAPVIEGQVATRLLARLGSTTVGQILGDGLVATLALHEPIAGTANLVPAGAVADVVAVRDGTAVNLLRPDPCSTHVPNHAGLPLADVSISGGEQLAAGPAAVAAHAEAIDEWLLLTASALVGIAESALQLAVAYAKERHAFGVPIGSFQAIAHRLADVATGVEGARLLVHEAAWTADSRLPEAGERASMAFAFAADVAKHATYWGVHTLGGYGVMLEYDAQLYFRRARGWAGVFGDAEAGYRRVARHRYGRRGA